MTIKEGWTGRVYEDFEVGDIYQHPLGRTVLPVDISWFTLLTQNTNPIHFDSAYAEKTEFGKPLVDSTFTLALVTGQSVTDISQNAMANLGYLQLTRNCYQKCQFCSNPPTGVHLDDEQIGRASCRERVSFLV